MHRLGLAITSGRDRVRRRKRTDNTGVAQVRYTPGGALLGTSRVSSTNSLSRASWPCRSTARRHMHADNAGVKRLNYTRESIPAAGGQQFDLVAVGVFDEGEDAGAVHHGTGFAHDLAAGGLDLFAGLVDIIHFDGDVTVAGKIG